MPAFDKPGFVAELAALLAKYKVSTCTLNVAAQQASSADDTRQSFELAVHGEWD